MPTQTHPYIVLTDGTTSCVFADGSGTQSNYSPIRGEWAPSISSITSSPLVGRGSRNMTLEEISINIYGTTATLALGRLATLAKLLDQADRWARGENVTPVLFKYAPQGSTISSTATPLQAVCYGRGEGDETSLALSQDFNQVGLNFQIPEVNVVFKRSGDWYLDTESDDSGAAVAINETMTCALTAMDEFSPSLLKISGWNPNVTPDTTAGFILFIDNAKYYRADASGLTATGFTSQADAAALPRNTNVLRYTGTVTTTRSSAASTIGLASGSTHYSVYVSLRNNHASATFQVSATLTNLAFTYTTQETYIDASTQNPRYICLGILPAINASDTVKLNVAASTSAGSPTIDFDQIFVMGVNDEGQRAISISALDLDGAYTTASTPVSLVIDHRVLTHRTPFVGAEKISDASRAPGTYRGNGFLVSKAASVLVVVLMANGIYWRFTNSSNAVITTVATVTRTKAYLTPQ